MADTETTHDATVASHNSARLNAHHLGDAAKPEVTFLPPAWVQDDD